MKVGLWDIIHGLGIMKLEQDFTGSNRELLHKVQLSVTQVMWIMRLKEIH